MLTLQMVTPVDCDHHDRGIIQKYQTLSLALCFGATWDIYLLIPFFKPKNTFLKSINTKNYMFTYTHPFCIFNKKKKNPKNGYTRNQPIHFSMAPKI